jgi:hypothetical protein
MPKGRHRSYKSRPRKIAKPIFVKINAKPLPRKKVAPPQKKLAFFLTFPGAVFFLKLPTENYRQLIVQKFD